MKLSGPAAKRLQNALDVDWKLVQTLDRFFPGQAVIVCPAAVEPEPAVVTCGTSVFWPL